MASYRNLAIKRGPKKRRAYGIIWRVSAGAKRSSWRHGVAMAARQSIERRHGSIAKAKTSGSNYQRHGGNSGVSTSARVAYPHKAAAAAAGISGEQRSGMKMQRHREKKIAAA